MPQAEVPLRGQPVAAGQGHPARATTLASSSTHQELVCSLIGLSLKTGLALVAVVSLVRLTSAYQTRMDRYGEISAVLGIQQAKLLKAQNRFDRLFATGGEQRLIEEQDQWIAPNRMRVVWQQHNPDSQAPFPTVEAHGARPVTTAPHP